MLGRNPNSLDHLEIGLASPDRIRFWSYGEVEKPETINYRTFKPERRGLFCEKIFGPIKDWECACGKYRRVRYRGIICERCGVEVTHSKVRRDRMGHIELAADVAHIWFLKGIPSYVGILLDMSSRQLEEIIYYDSYIVTEVDNSISDSIAYKQLLNTSEYAEYKEKYGDSFKAEMGASAIKRLLSELNIDEISKELREEVPVAKGQKKIKITKRLRVIDSFIKSGNRPEYMILEAIPVMPPDLRPMVQLEGGRFATSDLNDLYRRVVNRNNRLKRLIDIGAPEMIVRNEKRMLQEAVDVLISNGKRGRSVTGTNGRPLKSLGNIIEGKQGRFRQNLLGKRVDYSARSVIVVGPHLKFHQCGLPKNMALELFKPFVIRKLVEYGHVSNVKSAKRKIETKEVVVWDVLEEVIKGQTVLLNRAPTLHRLGIQAFEPILVEGLAIQVHPLVCTAFNADFDGDQMAVHVPLSIEAQAESRLLIMSRNNILSPSSGKSIVTPTQDMVLGIYFLTTVNDECEKGKGRYFYDVNEALRAYESGYLGIQTSINVRVDGKRIESSIGRLIFNTSIRDVLDIHNIPHLDFINEGIGKGALNDLVYNWYVKYGNDVISDLINKLKEIGFRYSTLSGISISVDDLKISPLKSGILTDAHQQVENLDSLESRGTISSREKQLRIHDIWREATFKVSNALSDELGQLNNVYIMANSGARGNMDQVRQLAGMRGLMSDAQGRTVDIPILSNFKEGLSITEYFISSYGARKGLVDTALRTADSGYLTRRLVDVAQDVMVSDEDCGTTEGVLISAIKDGINIIVNLAELINGRYTIDPVLNPNNGEEIIGSGQLITPEKAQEIQDSGLKSLIVRSVYKCELERGVCQKCYGLDLAKVNLVSIGEAVGIIAAQSIGEPGTQLTMRTFHTGGVDLRKASKVEICSKITGKIKLSNDLQIKQVKDEQGDIIWVNTRQGNIDVVDGKSNKRSYLVPVGSTILVKDGISVDMDTTLAEYDPSYAYVISSSEGVCKLIDLNPQIRKDSDNNIIEIVSKQDGEVFIYNPNIINEYIVPAKVAELYKVGDRLSANMEISSGIFIDSGGMINEIKPIDSTTKTKQFKLFVYPGDSYPVLSGTTLFINENSQVTNGEIIGRERVGLDGSSGGDIVSGLPSC